MLTNARPFSFVDQITQLDAGVRARGLFHVPHSVEHFPPSLVAEAIGQLAAWVAMDHLGFRVRPVAGIAAEARFLREVRPGEILELGVEIESCSESDVAYGGQATIDGELVVELQHCLGPMLPMVTFDSPESVRERFQLLRGPGAVSGGFSGVVEPRVVPIEHRAGRSLRVELHVPEAADFFADHFPNRPVFPATLLLNAQIGLACGLAAESGCQPGGPPPKALRVLDVKMRSFISPGQRLEVLIDLAAPQSGVATAKLTARSDGRRVASARVEIGVQESS